MPVIECDPSTARRRLEAAGIDVQSGNTEYEKWRAREEGATAVAYVDKVVVQGANPYDIIAHLEEGTGKASLLFDGASRGNPGPAAIGWVLATDDGVVAEHGECIGEATNNQAEYHALISGLEAAQAYGFHELEITGDSELIVKQVTGAYETRNPTLRELRVQVRELLEGVEDWELRHIPRSLNDRADALANEALDE